MAIYFRINQFGQGYFLDSATLRTVGVTGDIATPNMGLTFADKVFLYAPLGETSLTADTDRIVRIAIPTNFVTDALRAISHYYGNAVVMETFDYTLLDWSNDLSDYGGWGPGFFYSCSPELNPSIGLGTNVKGVNPNDSANGWCYILNEDMLANTDSLVELRARIRPASYELNTDFTLYLQSNYSHTSYYSFEIGSDSSEHTEYELILVSQTPSGSNSQHYYGTCTADQWNNKACHIRFQAQGTLLKAKVWFSENTPTGPSDANDGDANEPSEWTFTFDVGYNYKQAPGYAGIGFSSYGPTVDNAIDWLLWSQYVGGYTWASHDNPAGKYLGIDVLRQPAFKTDYVRTSYYKFSDEYEVGWTKYIDNLYFYTYWDTETQEYQYRNQWEPRDYTSGIHRFKLVKIDDLPVLALDAITEPASISMMNLFSSVPVAENYVYTRMKLPLSNGDIAEWRINYDNVNNNWYFVRITKVNANATSCYEIYIGYVANNVETILVTKTTAETLELVPNTWYRILFSTTLSPDYSGESDISMIVWPDALGSVLYYAYSDLDFSVIGLDKCWKGYWMYFKYNRPTVYDVPVVIFDYILTGAGPEEYVMVDIEGTMTPVGVKVPPTDQGRPLYWDTYRQAGCHVEVPSDDIGKTPNVVRYWDNFNKYADGAELSDVDWFSPDIELVIGDNYKVYNMAGASNGKVLKCVASTFGEAYVIPRTSVLSHINEVYMRVWCPGEDGSEAADCPVVDILYFNSDMGKTYTLILINNLNLGISAVTIQSQLGTVFTDNTKRLTPDAWNNVRVRVDNTNEDLSGYVDFSIKVWTGDTEPEAWTLEVHTNTNVWFDEFLSTLVVMSVNSLALTETNVLDIYSVTTDGTTASKTEVPDLKIPWKGNVSRAVSHSVTIPETSYHTILEYWATSNVGQPPTNWVALNGSSWVVASCPDGLGGKAVKLAAPSSLAALYYTFSDSVLCGEVAARIKTNSNTDEMVGYLYVNGSGGEGLNLYYATLLGGTTLKLGKIKNNVVDDTYAKTVTYNYSANTWHVIKLQTNNGVVKVKAWPDGFEEPFTWQIVQSERYDDYTSHLPAGTVGVGSSIASGDSWLFNIIMLDPINVPVQNALGHTKNTLRTTKKLGDFAADTLRMIKKSLSIGSDSTRIAGWVSQLPIDSTRLVNWVTAVGSDSLRYVKKYATTASDTLRALKRPGDFIADTLRAVVYVTPVVADTLRSYFRELTIRSDTLRIRSNPAEILADTTRGIKNLVSTLSDSYRSVIKSVVNPSDTRRSTSNPIQVASDTLRVIGLVTSPLADSLRTVYKSGITMTSDTLRMVEKVVSNAYDTARQRIASTTATPDTLRTVKKAVTIPSDTVRRIKKPFQVVSDTIRRRVRSQVTIADELRTVEKSVTIPGDTRRSLTNHYNITSDSLRYVKASQNIASDTRRNTVCSVLPIFDTARSVEYLLTIYPDTLRRVSASDIIGADSYRIAGWASPVEVDTLREVEAGTVIDTDTIRFIQYTLEILADTAREYASHWFEPWVIHMKVATRMDIETPVSTSIKVETHIDGKWGTLGFEK